MEYVRQARGALARAAEIARRLTDIYVLDGAGTSRFADDLTAALMRRGVRVQSVEWDANVGQLTAHGRPLSLSHESALPSPSSGEASPWLIALNPSSGFPLEELASHAHGHGVRVAAIVDGLADKGGQPRAGAGFPDPAALACLDKILASSPESGRLLSETMLGWPGKFVSAETRLRTIPRPNEGPSQSRAIAPRRDTGALLIGAVVGEEIRPAVLEVLQKAARHSPVQLKVALSGNASARIEDEVRFAPLERPVDGAESARDGEEENVSLAAADFIIYSGEEGKLDELIADCLWRGVPCLVHTDGGHAPDTYKPGVLFIDMRDSHDMARAVLNFCRTTFRQSFANEAIAQPIKTWDEYAAELCLELANDRPVDAVHRSSPIEPKSLIAPLGVAKRPRLSICISTYKRAGWLALNLRNIFDQLPPHDGSIEVVVVDNTSPDETPTVVKPYLSRRDFRYHRNPVNVGMLGNLVVTSQIARGDYVWILGDDDFTRPGTISKVLGLINEHDNLSLIYMNYGYTFEHDASKVTDLGDFLSRYNVLEPEGPDQLGTVAEIAAKSENFYTAIYCIIFRRDHAMRAYGQDTSGRIFSTMESCIPTAHYILNYMTDLPAYWIGSHALIMNSNVSWADYSPLFELEHFPRAWDLAERSGTPSSEVDRRRENRLPHTTNAWLMAFENDKAGNCAYISADRVMMRLKHIDKMREYIPRMYSAYRKAHASGNPAAKTQPEKLFAAFRDVIGEGPPKH